MKKIFIPTLFALIIILSACSATGYREISPDNKAINYSGRFIFQGSNKIVSDWPGTYFRCRFTGKSLGLILEGPSEVYFDVFIDDQPVKVISCKKGEVIKIAGELKPGKHTLQVYKRTESFLGRAVFKGLVIDKGGKILPWKNVPSKKIEFIGNSITCGYGVEGASRHEDFKAGTENNYLTYAAIISRAFNADYSIIAHSGKGVVRHYGDSLKVSEEPQMPPRYLRTLDSTDSIKWDFSTWKPDVVMINLGTNDFSTKPYPEREVFEKAYVDFISIIRGKYGDIPVFCISGPLIGDPCSAYVKEVVDMVKQQSSDSNIFFIGIPKDLLNSDEDFGSDEHPSVVGQKKIAEYIAPIISKQMGWVYSLENLK